MDSGEIVYHGIELVDLGVVRFLSPLAWFLVLAIAAELLVSKRAHDGNPWVALLSAITVFFRLYWVVWTVTLRQKDLTPFVDHETARMILLADLFLFIVTAIFIPFFAFSLGRIWSQRKVCGVMRSIYRTVPVCGMAYLFVSTLALALKFIGNMRTTL